MIKRTIIKGDSHNSARLCVAGIFRAVHKRLRRKRLATTSYTIVYDSQGGAAVENGTYTEGSSNKFYLPTPSIGSDPKMYGYSFTGWFYDAECTKKATAEIDTSYAKNGTLTLYAGWSNLHKIYFRYKKRRRP